MHGRIGFEGPLWLLLEKKTTFYAAKWQQVSVLLYTDLLEFSPQLQVLLRFQNVLFVVRRMVPVADDTNGKLKLQFEVRSMEDVRKAWQYQISAKTQLLTLYTDNEPTRERILSFINDPQQHPRSYQPPSSAPSSMEELNQRINHAFHALEQAQATRESGDLSTALRLYKDAERGFQRVEQSIPDERTRTLFQERRREIRQVIQALQEKLTTSNTTTSDADISDEQVNERMQTKEDEETKAAVLPVTPIVPALSTPPLEQPDTSPLSTIDMIEQRLQQLRSFAQQNEAQLTQQTKKPHSEDLLLRLQALKNEPRVAPSVDDLAERLRRLRGDGGSPSVNNLNSVIAQNAQAFNRLSSVEKIIQQVQDEIALGIEDDELAKSESDEEFESSSSGDDASSDSERDRSSVESKPKTGNKKIK